MQANAPVDNGMMSMSTQSKCVFTCILLIMMLITVVLPRHQSSTTTGLTKGVSAQCLFHLLLCLEGETQDALDALQLVKADKPLRSLGNTHKQSMPYAAGEA